MSETLSLPRVKVLEIAHELRAPLGGIAAMVDLLHATALDEQQREIIAALAESVAHLEAIASDILGGNKAGSINPGSDHGVCSDWGHKPASGEHEPAWGENAAPGKGEAPQEGKNQEEKKPQALQPLSGFLDRFSMAARARAASAGLDFLLDDPRAQEVAADGLIEAVPLRQVLENLVGNAVRLMDRGKITLEIARNAPDRLNFSLHDEGPGIDAAQAARLIREGGGLPGRPGGAGLGLRLAGRLVRERGGTLKGGMNAKGGAIFSFDWPVIAKASCQGLNAGAVREAPGARCLVVDDHPASRRVLMTILAAFKLRCDEASEVDEALELIAERDYSLVLTDLQMPAGGGARLIRQIAAQGAARPALVVISGEAEAISDDLAELIDGVAPKPISVGAIAHIVSRFYPKSSVKKPDEAAAIAPINSAPPQHWRQALA